MIHLDRYREDRTDLIKKYDGNKWNIIYVQRWDGKEEALNLYKIYDSISKARNETHEFEETKLTGIVKRISTRIFRLKHIDVNMIKAIIYEQLIAENHIETAEAYLTQRRFRRD